MRVAAISDVGLVRAKNEDRFLARPKRGLFAVCDGMGGHKGGEVAAALAIDVIDIGYGESKDPFSSLASCIETANQLIFTIGSRVPEYRDMGTTLTAAVIRDNRLWVAHIGDSSLYCISEGSIQKITHDHTLAQKMVDQGLMAPAESKKHPFSHILTRALGMGVAVEADYICSPLQKGDYILLATDGLTDLVEDQEIQALIDRFGIDSHLHMVRTALERGGHDNITVVLVQV